MQDKHRLLEKTEIEAKMDDGSVVYVSRGEKSGMWGITIAPPSIGATGVELTDEQMRTVLRLANAILGLRSADLHHDDGESLQFYDVYFTLRRMLGIDSPFCNAGVIDTVQGIMDDLDEARSVLSDLAFLMIYKAQNGMDEQCRASELQAWSGAFRIAGRGKEIELGMLEGHIPDKGLPGGRTNGSGNVG